jgi:hypothetical protein
VRRAAKDWTRPGGEANLLSGILAAYAARPGALPVDILFSGSTDRTDYLHDGRADAGLLYVPFDDLTGLAAETLQAEDRVAVPAGSAITGTTSPPCSLRPSRQRRCSRPASALVLPRAGRSTGGR